MLCQIILGSLLVASNVFTAKERVYIENGKEMIEDYQDRRLTNYGILDVTKAPYSADSSGINDSTRAIQEAVIDARDARMITYLPPGRYRVSDTISASQISQKRVSIPSINRRDDFPCILWGGTSGGGVVMNGASGLVGKLTAEVGAAAAGMPRKEANRILDKILSEYESPPPAGQTFPELYDVASVEPTQEHLEQYQKVKQELREFGIPFKQ